MLTRISPVPRAESRSQLVSFMEESQAPEGSRSVFGSPSVCIPNEAADSPPLQRRRTYFSDFRPLSLSGQNVSSVRLKRQPDPAARFTSSSVLPRKGMTAALSAGKLKELCLRILNETEKRIAVERHELSSIGQQELKYKRELALKFRAAVNAVTFTSILIHNKLERMTRQQESQFADPYVFIPGIFDCSTLDGRDLCLFKTQISHVYCEPFNLYFAVDRFHFTDQCDWGIRLLDEADVELAKKRFAEKKNCCVICMYNSDSRQLEPISTRPLHSTMGPHYNIIKDFLSQIQSVLDEEDISKVDYTTGDDLSTLLSIFSVPLPDHNVLKILPSEVRMTIKDFGIEVLRRYCYPRLLLRMKKRWRRKLLVQTYVPPLTLEALSKLNVWSSWPSDVLKELIKVIKPLVVERGELIIHEDENAQSGIFFLVSGSIDVLKKTSRKSKSLGPENTKVLVTLGPVACIGEFAFLTEDPRMASIRAASSCALWRLEKEYFHRLFAMLPRPIVDQLLTVAFDKRTANMPNTYPLTPAVLKEYSLFRNCTDPPLQKLLPFIKPRAIPKGTLLTRANEPAEILYFLRRGSCGVFRFIAERKEELHIVTISPPAVIGGDSVVFGGSYATTIRALTNCDLYMLKKEEFANVMSTFENQWLQILEQAREIRQSLLRQSQYRFKEMVVNIPFLRDMLSLTKRTELMQLFRPVVFRARQVVCSTATFADRVLILVEGSVRMENGSFWEQGESIGFTSIVPHRWALSAVAASSSKIIQLPVQAYASFLRQSGIYEDVAMHIRALMFPKAADSTILFESIIATQHLRTPPMYPVSHSATVNLHEPKFGLKVVPYLATDAKEKKVMMSPEPQKDRNNVIKEAAKQMMESIEQRICRRRAFSGVDMKVQSVANGSRHWSRGRSLLIQRVPTTEEWKRRENDPYSRAPV